MGFALTSLTANGSIGHNPGGLLFIDAQAQATSNLHSCHTVVDTSLDLSKGYASLVMDSDLDAFSQYPSLGSVATPVDRLTAETSGVP